MSAERYRENPPDRMITHDDIVFFDFGPVFCEWEADLGRTYVLGTDSDKLRLRDDVERAFAEGRRHFEQHETITGGELFEFMCGRAQQLGWEYGGPHCGHLLGEFPHEKKIGNDQVACYICAADDLPMRRNDPMGRPLHWILEVHFVDRTRNIGRFYEQLLTIDDDSARASG